MDLALAVVPSVAIVALAGLRALGMWLAHREKKLAHAPISELAAKIDALESRGLAQMRR